MLSLAKKGAGRSNPQFSIFNKPIINECSINQLSNYRIIQLSNKEIVGFCLKIDNCLKIEGLIID